MNVFTAVQTLLYFECNKAAPETNSIKQISDRTGWNNNITLVITFSSPGSTSSIKRAILLLIGGMSTCNLKWEHYRQRHVKWCCYKYCTCAQDTNSHYSCLFDDKSCYLSGSSPFIPLSICCIYLTCSPVAMRHTLWISKPHRIRLSRKCPLGLMRLFRCIMKSSWRHSTVK